MVMMKNYELWATTLKMIIVAVAIIFVMRTYYTPTNSIEL